MAKLALGKGLGALIAQKPAVTAPTLEPGERVQRISLSEIVPTPLQPRMQFQPEALHELADSIREHGIIQPLIVRRVGTKLELIAGERRWRAATQAGLSDAPVIVREATDLEVLELALIENLQRADLNPIEEAVAYQRLGVEFGLKQEEIAQKVGKSRASVANAVRLLELHPQIQTYVVHGQLSVGHAKVILGVKDHSEQLLLAEQLMRTGATVRAAERLIAEHLAQTNTPRTGRAKNGNGVPQLTAALESVRNRLRDHLATQVELQHRDRKGRIEIEYYGADDLNRILALLGLPQAD